MAGAASLTFNIIGRDQTQSAFRSAAAGAKKLGAGMKAGIAGAAMAIAGGGILSVGNDMIQIASDISESTSKVTTLLGDFSDGAIETAEVSAKAMGISKNEYLAAIGNMAAVDRAMGTNKAQAAKLAGEYVALSADLGSFNNASSAEVQEALTASLAGEYEMLKKYGIVVNDTTLAAEAQRIGMEKQGSTWDSAQKRQLSYNIIMRSTKAAQGDFARTSSGLANSTKIVQARFTDLKGVLGAKLLPAAVKVMGWLDKGIDIAYKLGGALRPLMAHIRAFTNSLRGNSDAGEGATGTMAKWSRAGKAVAAWIRNDLVPAVKTIAAWIKNDFVPAVKAVAGWLGRTLGPVIVAVAQNVRTHIIPAVQGLIAKFREAWPTISRVIQILGKVVEVVISRVAPVLVKLVGVYLSKVIATMGTVWSAVWKVVKVVIDVGEKVVAAGRKFWDFAQDVGGAVKRGYDAVREWIGKAVDKVKALPGDALRAVGDLGRTLYQKGIDLLQGFINGIKDKAREIPGMLKDVVVSPINAVLPGFLEIGSPSKLTRRWGRWTVEGFELGLKDRDKRVGTAMEKLTGRVAAAVDKLKAKVDSSKQIASDIRSSFADLADITTLETGPEAAKGFLAQLADRAVMAERFAKAVTALRRKGLDRRAIEDLTAAGVEGGLPAAEELLRGGIGQANTLMRRIHAAGGSLGAREAYARTGIAVDARGRAVVGTGRQRVAIDLNLSGASDDITAAIINAIRKQVRVSGGDVNVVLGTARR